MVFASNCVRANATTAFDHITNAESSDIGSAQPGHTISVAKSEQSCNSRSRLFLKWTSPILLYNADALYENRSRQAELGKLRLSPSNDELMPRAIVVQSCIRDSHAITSIGGC